MHLLILDGFHRFAVVKNAAMNVGVQTYLFTSLLLIILDIV